MAVLQSPRSAATVCRILSDNFISGQICVTYSKSQLSSNAKPGTCSEAFEGFRRALKEFEIRETDSQSANPIGSQKLHHRPSRGHSPVGHPEHFTDFESDPPKEQRTQ